MLRVNVPWRHGHQARNRQMRAVRCRLEQSRHVLGPRAALALLIGKLDFEQDFERRQKLSRCGVETRQQLGGIGRLNNRKKLAREPRFIGLQMSDEMIFRLAKIVELWPLPGEFLNIILTEFPQSRRISRAQMIRGKLLRNRDQRDIRAPPSAPLSRSRNAALHFSQAIRELRVVKGQKTIIGSIRCAGQPIPSA